MYIALSVLLHEYIISSPHNALTLLDFYPKWGKNDRFVGLEK